MLGTKGNLLSLAPRLLSCNKLFHEEGSWGEDTGTNTVEGDSGTNWKGHSVGEDHDEWKDISRSQILKNSVP